MRYPSQWLTSASRWTNQTFPRTQLSLNYRLPKRPRTFLNTMRSSRLWPCTCTSRSHPRLTWITSRTASRRIECKLLKPLIPKSSTCPRCEWPRTSTDKLGIQLSKMVNRSTLWSGTPKATNLDPSLAQNRVKNIAQKRLKGAGTSTTTQTKDNTDKSRSKMKWQPQKITRMMMTSNGIPMLSLWIWMSKSGSTEWYTQIALGPERRMRSSIQNSNRFNICRNWQSSKKQINWKTVSEIKRCSDQN